MILTDEEAGEITGECIEAIERQTKFILSRDNNSTETEEFFEAVRPKGEATIELVESIKAEGPMKPIASKFGVAVVLLETTVGSIARALADQGFGSEARRIVDVLERHDAAAQQH